MLKVFLKTSVEKERKEKRQYLKMALPVILKSKEITYKEKAGAILMAAGWQGKRYE